MSTNPLDEVLTAGDAIRVIRERANDTAGMGAIDSAVVHTIAERAINERVTTLLEGQQITVAQAQKLGGSVYDMARTTADAIQRSGANPEGEVAKKLIDDTLTQIKRAPDTDGVPTVTIPTYGDKAIDELAETMRQQRPLPVLSKETPKDVPAGNLFTRANNQIKTFAQSNKWITLGGSSVLTAGGFYALYDAVARDERTDRETGETVKRGIAPRTIQGTLGALAAAVGTTGIVHGINAVRGR